MAATKHYHTRFEEHKFYHIYNRTVDKKPMFSSDDNYRFFLQRYDHYLSPVLDTYAYCLLGNHFHLLVRVKDLTTFQKLSNLPHDGPHNTNTPSRVEDLSTFEKLSNLSHGGQSQKTNLPHGGQFQKTDNPSRVEDLTPFQKLSNLPHAGQSRQNSPHDIISHQFRKFFQSYAMAFNKQHNRIGTLFQTPFKRAVIESEQYFRNLTCYIHHNPQLHGLIDDYSKWPWSPYNRILSDNVSKLNKQEVIRWFGGKEAYTAIHSHANNSTTDQSLMIEDD
jgi:hypothetical protein